MPNELMSNSEAALAAMDNAAGVSMGGTGGEPSVIVQMASAELDQQIVTARKFPRSLQRVQRTILSLATLDEETAAECVYALPRGGKPVRGPSVRFAEIIASAYGNCQVASRVVAVDKFDKVVIAEGVFWDLETGLRRTAQIRRRITDKSGRMFNEDMIVVTGNAAASIAMREAVLKGVPKALWRAAYASCDEVLAGNVKTLNERRQKALAAFAAWGVKPELIFEKLEVAGEAEIDLDEIASLMAIYNGVRAGESSIESHFPSLAGSKGGDKPHVEGKSLAEKMGNLVDEKDAGEPEAKDGEGDNAPDATAEAGAPKGEAEKPKATPKDDAPADTAPTTYADPEPTEEEIDEATGRGRDACENGAPRRTVPTDLSPPLREAWLDGWDRERKAIDAAGVAN